MALVKREADATPYAASQSIIDMSAIHRFLVQSARQYPAVGGSRIQSPIGNVPPEKRFWEECEPSTVGPPDPACNGSPKKKRGGQVKYDWPRILALLDRFIADGGTVRDFCASQRIPERTLFYAMDKYRPK